MTSVFQHLDDPVALAPSTPQQRADTVRRGERLRRRRRWVQTGVVAAVVTVCAAALFVRGGPARLGDHVPIRPEPVVPKPPIFSAQEFAVPLSLAIPEWASALRPNRSATHRLITWEQSQCSDACADSSDRKLRILAPLSVVAPGSIASTPFRDYTGYLDYLAGLVQGGVITTSSTDSTTVDGHPATVLTVSTLRSVEGAIGCELPPPSADSCWGFIAGMRLRLAVIDLSPGLPLLVWERTNDPSIAAGTADRDMGDVLATMRFGVPDASPTSAPTASTSPLQGTWRTSYTLAQARAVLARAGLSSTAETVLRGIDTVSTWELRIDGERYGLYRVGAGGSTVAEDGMSYVFDGTTLVGDPDNINGTRTTYRVSITGSAMTWTLVSDESPPFAPGVPDEAIQRVQYTTGLWTRVS